MVEPNRKREKGASRNIKPSDRSEAAPALAGVIDDPDSRITAIVHEFSTGKSRADPRGASSWKGAFTGRPQLISELAPYIRIRGGSTADLDRVASALRAWWRFFDKNENIAPVHSVEDLDDIHGALQIRDEMPAHHTSRFLALVNAVRSDKGLSKLFWAKIHRPSPVVDVPELEHVRPIYHELKHLVFAMYRRWTNADELAGREMDWDVERAISPQHHAWTAADVHATYRGLQQRLNHPCPSAEMCSFAFHTPFADLPYLVSEAVYGCFPSRDDVQTCLFLFLLRTGWNGAVALSINVEQEDNWIRPHPTSLAHHIVFSLKKRGNTEQVAIGLNKSELSPGNMIRALLARTEPLRKMLREELAHLLERRHSVAIAKRIRTLWVLLKSPWLYVADRRHNDIRSLDITSYGDGSQGKARLTSIINRLNESRVGKHVIPRMTLSDFRDAYISYAYEHSGYSWLVAQLAAGHSSLESLKTYLRKRRWKARGEDQTRKFGDALWTEVEQRRVVDPAILFALVQRGEVTEGQRSRWLAHKDRTRVGMGCRDFLHPPHQIAPHHVDGLGCRVQRCTLCCHGIVFEDSLEHLARRRSELDHLKTELPVVTWFESSFADELEATETTLRLFDPDLAAKRVLFWNEEIRAGRHIPMHLEGEYGTL